MSRFGLIQGSIWKDIDTSDMAALTVLWSIFAFFVVPNWCLRTDSANDDTSVVLDPFLVQSRNFSLAPTCVSNVHHLSQLPCFLVVVALDIP